MTRKTIGKPIVVGGVHKMPLSQAVRAGDFVFVSGQTAIDPTGAILAGGVEAQTRLVMERLRAILAEAGCGLEDVVKTTVWLEDARDFWSFNRVYGEFFPDNPPARSTVRPISCSIARWRSK
jgi:reactive intermediate/imine deaminase